MPSRPFNAPIQVYSQLAYLVILTLTLDDIECEEGFRQPRQLLQHSRRYHSNSPVKPSADPFVPTTSSPPMCPDNLPSYMVVARQISPYSISRERHDAIGPVILKNMMPPTNASWKRNKTLLSPSKRTGVQPSDAILEDEYDFVAYRPSPSYRPSTAAKIRTLGDLQSARVSELAQKGLTLWGMASLNELIDEKPPEVKETPASEIIHVQ
uniref:C2H2-type domain-containing protein n=1 Tax=Moniliophthora roreri TaxID=221103 RepID=A0A0W0FPP1_MONRR